MKIVSKVVIMIYTALAINLTSSECSLISPLLSYNLVTPGKFLGNLKVYHVTLLIYFNLTITSLNCEFLEI